MADLNHTWAMKEAAQCLLCNDAPCWHGCPAAVNPSHFIRKIRFENFAGAVRELRRANVLAAVCSYICPCLETCVGECASKKLNDPINIIALQRFICSWEIENGMVEPSAGAKTGKRVAIVGSGPAGLACSAELAVRGHVPVVFDSASQAGGMLSGVIPEFRLPKKVLDFEIEFIKKLGVEFMLGAEISDLDKLLADGFSAVFLATGTGKSKKSGIIGEEKKGVYQALEFLKMARVNGGLKAAATNNIAAGFVAAAFRPPQPTTNDQRPATVVIGGGDTAIDSARVLARAGQRVTLVYRRGKSSMPAYRPDVAEAEKEGVEFMFNVLPRSIIGGESAEGLKAVRIRWRDGGRAATGYDVEGTEFTIPCGAVILAIGQESSNLFDLRTSPNGYIAIDKQFMTSRPGIFAGGDIVSGPATAVAAVGMGKQAAVSMDKWLCSGGRPPKKYSSTVM